MYVLKNQKSSLEPQKLRDSRTFAPIVQGLLSQGGTRPEWVKWPTLPKRCHPIISALTLTLSGRAGLGCSPGETLPSVTVLNPQRAPETSSFVF